MARESYTITSAVHQKAQRTTFRHLVYNTYGRLWMSVVLALADLFCLSLATLIAAYIRLLPEFSYVQEYTQLFITLAFTFLVLFIRAGLYPAVGLDRVEELRQIVVSTSFAFLLIIGFTFLIKTTSIYSRITLVTTWILCMIFIPFGRFLARRICIRLKVWGEPVAIIGNLDRALPLADYFKRMPQLGIRPVVVLRDELSSYEDFKAYPPMTSTEIKEYADKFSLRTVLLVVNDLNYLDSFIDHYRYVFQHVILIKHKRGRFGLNTLKALDFSDVLGLQVRHNLLSPWNQIFKRFVDIFISSIALLFLAPFFALTAVLIKIESPGGVFYRQQRLGKGGQVFSILKFRTMYMNADEVLQEKLLADPVLKKEYDQYQKLKNDPRITRIGSFLRKFSLDELPQLWNVLIGKMSVVGPRPIMLNQEKMYGKVYKDYIQVMPGMTGLWQISGRNRTTFRRRAELDNEYIQRWSLWMDIYIMLVTVKVVLFREGAY